MEFTCTSLGAAAAFAFLAVSVAGQSARSVRGASPLLTIDNEPAPGSLSTRQSPRLWRQASSTSSTAPSI